jgi:hypothetical protein
MDRWFILAGLSLNLIGVILIYIGARKYKDFPVGSQTSSKTTGYLTIFSPPWLLPVGLVFIIVGIVSQIIGVLIN